MLLRLAEPEDALAVARVHVRAWQAGYRGLLPEEYLSALRVEERASRYTFGRSEPGQPTTIVAVDADVIVGLAGFGKARDAELPDDGELRALYVDPEWWGRGVGRSLIAEARGRLVGAGFPSAVLWVMANNTRAKRFYEADGWKPDGARKSEVLGNVRVDEVRRRRELA
jgi:ribosomal protein S18 acetylase RimI-like enzyme